MMKRPDIQGVRGLAIAAVLAFHLDDKRFPAGFIGVDIFFVLSGYLMSVILSKENNLNLTVFRDFYTRRFKRIVPLYAILLFSLTIIVPCFLLKRDVLKFCKDVVWAALFATNIQVVLEKKDYFTELFDSNVLTHTWSLGVEIQYYIIVPFIVLSHRKLSKQCKYPFLIILLAASLMFQLFSSPTSAFNFLPARVWQFLAGGLVHELSTTSNCLTMRTTNKYEKLGIDENANQAHGYEERKQAKIFGKAIGHLATDLISLALCALVLSPWMILPAPLLRLIAVCLTSSLLVLGCEKNRQGVLLTNRPLVYLGDLSYVVYLTHWPIIIIWKSVNDSATVSLNGIIYCLATTFIVSILVHTTAEQYFIRSKENTAILFVSSLYGMMVVFVMLNGPLEMNKALEAQVLSSTSVNISEAIAFNERAAKNEYTQHMPFKECVDDPEGRRMRPGFRDSRANFECVWKRQNATGNVTILVTGNSIAQIAMKILKSIIEKENLTQVSIMRLVSMPACYPLEHVYYTCPGFLKSLPQVVQAMKPDLTFAIYDEMHINVTRLNSPILNATTDKTVTEFAALLQPLVSASKFVIYDELYPRPPLTLTAGMGVSMQKRLSRNQSLDDLMAPLDSFKSHYAAYFTRLDLLRFPNLIRHDTSTPLCQEETGVCWWYNRRNLHSYFNDHSHLTADGLELLRESYTKILKDLLAKLQP